MKNRIRECRKAAGMSQAELGNAVGLVDNAISNYENNLREPDLAKWEGLASALHVSPAYLVGWSDEPSEENPDTFKDYVNNRLEPEPYYDFAKPKPTSGVKVTLDDGRVIYDSREYDDLEDYSLHGDWLFLNDKTVAMKHIVSIEKVGDES